MDAVAKEEKRIEAAEVQETVASYLETEKEFFLEIETKALQEEEAALLSLMDQEAAEEAKIEIDKWCHLDINLVEIEKITSHLNKAKEEKKSRFSKKNG
jgi:hypothetical protein